jgi:hypothetical protein
MAEVIGIDGKSPVKRFLEEHSEDELEAYIEAVRDGMGLDLAARSIGLTATRMRRYAKREPELAERISAAHAEGREHYQDQLKAAAHDLALDTQNPNPRILEVELAAHGGPEYAHLRRDRVKHEGRVEHALVVDLTQLNALPIEKLREIEAILAPVVDQRELTG